MGMFDDFLQNAGNTVDALDVTASPKAPKNDGLQVQPRIDDPGSLQTSLPGPIMPMSDQSSQPVGLNYNNTGASGAMESALMGEGTPRGGSANPGLYGLLPQGLQHGTLRNVLGALGDAFLVGSGKQAQYGPRMERQEIGRAMAGYDPNDPQAAMAAIQRIAGTGAKGSTEMADQLQKNYDNAQLRRQLMEQNQRYHEATIQSKNDNLFNRMNPVVQADLAQATSAEDYAERKARWDARVGAIAPGTDAVSAFGIPDQFTPGAVNENSGLTSGQIRQSKDKGLQRQTSERDTDVAARSRLAAAGIGANSRNYATDTNAARPSAAATIQGLINKQNAGQPLTPAEQRYWDHATQTAKRTATLPPGLMPTGSHPKPTPNDIQYAKAHPEARAAFKQHFGVDP